MNPSVKNKPEDGMVIKIVSQRNPIAADRLPHRLKMLKGRLSFDHPRPHYLPRVVIFGQNQILFLLPMGNPEMIRGVMLKQRPGPEVSKRV